MERQTTQSSGGKQPISRHPLFPAIVALWFGALLGLGSLAIRPAVLESLAIASRIDLILPAAAPPLGLKARLLLALVLAVAGGALGAWLARRLAAHKPRDRARSTPAEGAPRVRARDAHPDSPPRRPFSATADFDTADPEAQGAMADEHGAPRAGRRRVLAMVEDTSPVLVPEFAPLPGRAAPPVDLGQTATAPEPPLELAELADAPVDEAIEVLATESLAIATPTAAVEPACALAAPEPVGNATVALDAPAERLRRAASFPFPQGTAAERLLKAPVDTLSHVELIERLALSIQRKRDAVAHAPDLHEPPLAVPRALETTGGLASDPIPERTATFVQAMESAPAQPLFARTENGSMAMPAALRPLSFDATAGEDDEDEAFLSFLPPRSIALDGDAPSSAIEDSATGPTEDGVERPVEAEPDSEDAEDEDADEGNDSYSSLLSLGRQGGRTPFVRIEEPEPIDAEPEPIVVFPGQYQREAAANAAAAAPLAQTGPAAMPPARPRRFDAPPGAVPASVSFEGPFAAPSHPAPPFSAPTPAPGDVTDTEEALRAALATLQRMSGAA